MSRRESARIKGKRYKHLLYSDEEVDDECEKQGKCPRKVRKIAKVVKAKNVKPCLAKKKRVKVEVEVQEQIKKEMNESGYQFEEAAEEEPMLV